MTQSALQPRVRHACPLHIPRSAWRWAFPSPEDAWSRYPRSSSGLRVPWGPFCSDQRNSRGTPRQPVDRAPRVQAWLEQQTQQPAHWRSCPAQPDLTSQSLLIAGIVCRETGGMRNPRQPVPEPRPLSQPSDRVIQIVVYSSSCNS